MEFSADWLPRSYSVGGRRVWAKAEWRRFYLDLPNRFSTILAMCRPVLEKVYQDELLKSPPADIFTVFRPTGFGVKDPNEEPVHWDVSFENTGDEFLVISIPFQGEIPMSPEVETC